MRIILSLIIISTLVFTSCKKDDVIKEPEDHSHHDEHTHKGSVQVSITNMLDTNLFYLDTLYVLGNGNKLQVSRYKYYISNIKLLRADSTYYAETYSYHLIDAATAASKSFLIPNVPEGEYVGIEFMIGVDSAHNVSGSQTGDLSISLGMFWAWNTGYIMAKLEGTSQQSPDPGNRVDFHIGGFQGAYPALKTVPLSFNSAVANVSQTHTPVVSLKADLAEWFKSPNAINFSTVYNVTIVGPDSKSLADNYADMFSVSGIQ